MRPISKQVKQQMIEFLGSGQKILLLSIILATSLETAVNLWLGPGGFFFLIYESLYPQWEEQVAKTDV